MLGINPVSMVKNEVKKIDLNDNGIPDAIEVLDGLEASCDAIANFVEHFNESDIIAIVKSLPPEIQSKLPAESTKAFARAVDKLPGQLKAAKVAFETIEAALAEKR